MHNPEEKQKCSVERDRSYLFLSMILLVLNLIATADASFRNNFSATSREPVVLSASVIPSSAAATAYIPGDSDKPLTPRQQYLLGKQLDINKATMEEFNSLPGISSTMAAAIVKERERLGGFRSPNDLLRVKGVKEKRLEKILPFLKKS